MASFSNCKNNALCMHSEIWPLNAMHANSLLFTGGFEQNAVARKHACNIICMGFGNVYGIQKCTCTDARAAGTALRGIELLVHTVYVYMQCPLPYSIAGTRRLYNYSGVARLTQITVRLLHARNILNSN